MQIILTNREAYLKSRDRLSALYEEDEAGSICRRLFEDVFFITPNALVTSADQAFLETEKLEACMQRLMKHEPIQHVTGFEMFHGLHIEVGPEVLIPRPETAELVDWVCASLDAGKTFVMADICTGSGCIALAVKQYFPSARIIATDISAKALELAKKNELHNFNENKIEFERHDILNDPWLFGIPGIVVCNPPYIVSSEAGDMAGNVLEFEPQQALFVQDDDALAFYKKIISIFLPGHPVNIYFELNPLTAVELQGHCEQIGLKSDFRRDMQDKIRFAHIYY